MTWCLEALYKRRRVCREINNQSNNIVIGTYITGPCMQILLLVEVGKHEGRVDDIHLGRAWGRSSGQRKHRRPAIVDWHDMRVHLAKTVAGLCLVWNRIFRVSVELGRGRAHVCSPVAHAFNRATVNVQTGLMGAAILGPCLINNSIILCVSEAFAYTCSLSRPIHLSNWRSFIYLFVYVFTCLFTVEINYSSSPWFYHECILYNAFADNLSKVEKGTLE